MTRLLPFELHRPGSVEEATALLDELGDDAVAYAGGTELFLLFKFGFAEYPHVVDLKSIAELSGIEVDSDWLRIGATETHRRIERHPEVRSRWRALAEMERGVGNLRVRTMGSLGGNLCFADPHSDPATFLLATDALVEARRGGGEARRLPIGDFVVGPFENSLQDGELLTAVLVPALPTGAAIVHCKFVLHERPAVTLTARLRLEDGRLGDVRVAVGSAGIAAARAEGVESALEGTRVDELDELMPDVRALVGEAADPVEDANGSVEYKRHLAGVLAERGLRAAVAEAASANGSR